MHGMHILCCAHVSVCVLAHAWDGSNRHSGSCQPQSILLTAGTLASVTEMDKNRQLRLFSLPVSVPDHGRAAVSEAAGFMTQQPEALAWEEMQCTL